MLNMSWKETGVTSGKQTELIIEHGAERTEMLILCTMLVLLDIKKSEY